MSVEFQSYSGYFGQNWQFQTVFGSSNQFLDEAKPSLEPQYRNQRQASAQSTNNSSTWSPFCLCPLYCPPQLFPNHLLRMWRLNETLLANKQMELFSVIPCDLTVMPCDAVLRSVSIFVEEKQAGLPSLPTASTPDTIPRTLVAPTPPLCQALPSTSGDRACCNLLSFYCSLGSHTSRCQIWPQALAIKCPLAFSVWILKWRETLSWSKPVFLQVRTHHPSFHWPALSQK